MFNQEWEIKPRALNCKICAAPFTGGQIYVSSLRLNGAEYERSDWCENCWKQVSDNRVGRTTPEKDGHDKAWPSTPQENSLISTVEGRASSRPHDLRNQVNGEASKPDSASGQPVLPKVGDAFSVWRGVFQAESLPPEVLKKETAESLLRKLIEKNDPQHRNTIFILAVMLERRRILAEKPARPPAAPGAQRLRAGNATHPPATLARSDCGLGSVAGGEVQKTDALTMIRVYEHRKTGEIFIVSDPMLRLDQLGHVQEEVSALLSGQA